MPLAIPSNEVSSRMGQSSTIPSNHARNVINSHRNILSDQEIGCGHSTCVSSESQCHFQQYHQRQISRSGQNCDCPSNSVTQLRRRSQDLDDIGISIVRNDEDLGGLIAHGLLGPIQNIHPEVRYERHSTSPVQLHSSENPNELEHISQLNFCFF